MHACERRRSDKEEQAIQSPSPELQFRVESCYEPRKTSKRQVFSQCQTLRSMQGGQWLPCGLAHQVLVWLSRLVLADSFLQPATGRDGRALRSHRVGRLGGGLAERILDNAFACLRQRKIALGTSCWRWRYADVVTVRAVVLDRWPPRRFEQTTHRAGGKPRRVILADHRFGNHAAIANQTEQICRTQGPQLFVRSLNKPCGHVCARIRRLKAGASLKWIRYGGCDDGVRSAGRRRSDLLPALLCRSRPKSVPDHCDPNS